PHKRGVLIHAPVEPGPRWDEEEFEDAKQGDNAGSSESEPDDGKSFAIAPRFQVSPQKVDERNHEHNAKADQPLREIDSGVENRRWDEEIGYRHPRERDHQPVGRDEPPETAIAS